MHPNHTPSATQLQLTFEEWRKVVGYEHRYEVSNFGNVRNFVTGRVLLAYKSTSGGHLGVNLLSGGRNTQKPTKVHFLVASAFIGPRPDGHVIHHINEDRLDNRPENLCYISRADHSRLHNSGERCGTSKLKKVQVHEIRHLLETTELMHKQIAAMYGVVRPTITKIAGGLRWKSSG